MHGDVFPRHEQRKIGKGEELASHSLNEDFEVNGI